MAMEAMCLRDHFWNAGILLPVWPSELIGKSEGEVAERANSYAKRLLTWKTILMQQDVSKRKKALCIACQYLKTPGAKAWEVIVCKEIIADLAEAGAISPGNEQAEIHPELINCLSVCQVLGYSLVLAKSNKARDALSVSVYILEANNIPVALRVSAFAEVVGALLSKEGGIQEEQIIFRPWEVAVTTFSMLTSMLALIIKYSQATSDHQAQLNSSITDDIKKLALETIQVLGQSEKHTRVAQDVFLAAVGAQLPERNLEYSVAQPNRSCADDGFSDRVHSQIYSFIKLLAVDKCIDKIDKIVVISGRMERYFDPCLGQSLVKTMCDLWDQKNIGIGMEGVRTLLVGNFCDVQVTPNTLYIVCIHAMPGEIELISSLRSSSTIVIGWFWDNHHHYTSSLYVSSLLDIAMPAHYYAHEIISKSQKLSTSPLPLATCQWSIPTFKAFSHMADQSSLKYLMIGRYSDWSVSPQRSEAVDLLNAFFADNPLVDLSVSSPDRMRFVELSPLQSFLDWRSSATSLVLAVRNDLSMRFFDSLLCGCVPIVDSEISNQALQDLAPGIVEGCHYLTCNPRDPVEIKNVIRRAVGLRGRYQAAKSVMLLADDHMIEARFALIIHAVLTALSD